MNEQMRLEKEAKLLRHQKIQKEKEETMFNVIKMCKSENYDDSYSDDEMNNSMQLPVDLN
jgi:hypothetical protein